MRCNHDLDAPDEACTLFMQSVGVFFCEYCDAVFVGMPPTKRNGLTWTEGTLAAMRESILDLQLSEAKPDAN
jgi:hypothetical protein